MNFLKLPEQRLSLFLTLILIIAAYLFSLTMRYIWVQQVQGIEAFHWNGELMLNTNDGYYFAEGARDILQGSHEPNDLSPVYEPISIITAFLSTTLPIHFETLILYMSAVFGSLIVVPIILIGRSVGQTYLGFFASLIAGIANSYYNRTMIGYYDTDMFSIVLPLFGIYFTLQAIKYKTPIWLFATALSFSLAMWWYPQSYSLSTAILGTVFLYWAIFERKELAILKIVPFILIAIIPIPLWAKIAVAGGLSTLFYIRSTLDAKWVWALLGMTVAVYFVTGGFDPVWAQLKVYLFRENVANDGNLNFYNVAQTVREAGHIPFDVFAQRISGHVITFVLGVIGYILAVIAYRPLIITLPMVGLGFIAMNAGLRFTIYAVAPIAIGFSYFLFLITRPIEKPWLRNIVLLCFSALALYPNYQHIKEYITPTVFNTKEVTVLDKMQKIASREDYVVSWWDYGYPIRYYSDVKTLVDGGKHNGDVNYPVSYILTRPVTDAALMSRLAVEYTEKGFENNKTDIIAQMLADYKAESVDDMIDTLSLDSASLPKPTRDVYLFLPIRMLELLPTVSLFSNLDLKHPDTPPAKPVFYITDRVNDTGNTIDMGNNISLDKTKNVLKLGSQEVPIKRFAQVGYVSDGKLSVNEQQFASEGLNVIVMASYGRFLIVDDYYYNSSFVQMFVFEKYDPKLFEPVILDPMAKVYKLKI